MFGQSHYVRPNRFREVFMKKLAQKLIWIILIIAICIPLMAPRMKYGS